MPLITDPDSLTDGQEIVVSTAGKTIRLVVVDQLSTDGVTIKCVYSKLKELWKDDTNYIKFPFPMGPITDEQFEMINGWDWYDDSTRYLLRTGGWALKDAGGVSLEEWAGIISLGIIAGGDQAYFTQSDIDLDPSTFNPSALSNDVSNFELTGPVNQAVKVYGDVTHGNFNYRSYFKIYCRIYQKSYAFSQLSEIGVSSLTYQAYRFPLANGSDVKITHTDGSVGTTTPYTGMDITWYNSPQARDIGGVNKYFHVIIDGNNATAEQIYEFVQWKLRQPSDIDYSGDFQFGLRTGSLLEFVGDTLYTLEVAEGGVFIDNYQNADINRLRFTDDNGDVQQFPYVAVLTLNFGDNLINDASAKYWVYFTNDEAGADAGYDYGTANAILVKDADDVDMTNTVSAQSSVQLTYAYDDNDQRGLASKGVDAPITCVAIGLSTGQFVKATGTIAESISNSVSLVAPLERNYQNV